MTGKKVVVIGGGVIGLSAAYYCQRQGMDVTVVERLPEQRDGCSFGNAGMIVPSHFVPLAAPGMVALGLKWMWNPESPFYIKPRLDLGMIRWGWQFWRASTAAKVKAASPVLRDLNLASRTLYQELESSGHQFGLVQKGLVMLCKTEHALHEEAAGAEKAVSLGVPAEVLSAEETAKLDPSISMDIKGSVYYPKDCHLQPERFVRSLQTAIVHNGGKIHWGSEVTSIRRQGSKISSLVTNHGEIEGDQFVLAGGAWSPELSQSLALSIPMQAGKGYSLTLSNPVELPVLCSICVEARLAVTPMGGKLRFGGTMEISGLSESINPRRVQGIIKAIPAYFPKFKTSDFDGIQPWRGLRPCSPDGLPYLGRTNRADNLTIATGHAMMGLSLAPITGRLVSEIVSGQTPSIDLKLLSPDRYN